MALRWSAAPNWWWEVSVNGAFHHFISGSSGLFAEAAAAQLSMEISKRLPCRPALKVRSLEHPHALSWSCYRIIAGTDNLQLFTEERPRCFRDKSLMIGLLYMEIKQQLFLSVGTAKASSYRLLHCVTCYVNPEQAQYNMAIWLMLRQVILPFSNLLVTLIWFSGECVFLEKRFKNEEYGKYVNIRWCNF